MASKEEKETLLRCTCSFIKKLCNRLDLQLLSQSTALVYFHRFMAVQEFLEHDRFVLGTACVFLAAKVEEEMRRLDQVVKQAQALVEFSHPESVIREKVLLCERVLLHSLSFDISVTHPHVHAYNILFKYKPQGGQKAVTELRQVAWNFLNDSLFTDLCVRVNPEQIAAASVVLVYHFYKAREEAGGEPNLLVNKVLDLIGKELREKPRVYDQDPKIVQAIVRDILKVYQAPRPFCSDSQLLQSANGNHPDTSAKKPRIES